MKKTILLSVFLMASMVMLAQKYITKNGLITFHSETPMETIEAKNNQVNCAFDKSNGNFVFKVLIKSFEFPKALMQEHFNENYLESDKYPNSTFSGKITNLNELDFSAKGEQKVQVEGELTIHGVTQKVKHEGTFVINGDMIKATSSFQVALEDYKIKRAKAVIENIAEVIDVKVVADLKEFKK